MAKTEIKQKQGSCGGCSIDWSSPPKGNPQINEVNVKLGFEEALKLKAAVDEAVADLNRADRRTAAAKRAALKLTVSLKQGRVKVFKGFLPKSR